MLLVELVLFGWKAYIDKEKSARGDIKRNSSPRGGGKVGRIARSD